MVWMSTYYMNAGMVARRPSFLPSGLRGLRKWAKGYRGEDKEM